MPSFTPLTVENFDEFEPEVLRSEEVFPADIRETSESYREALAQQRSVGLVLRLEDRYVGNAVGFEPDASQRALLRLDEVPSTSADLIYLFNIVTLPEFQNRGLGRRLLAEFMEHARRAGFRTVGGHFRGNGSLKNFKTLGGQELGVFHDWFDTGESYTYCELKID